MMLYLTRSLDRARFDVTLAVGLKRGPYLPLVPPNIEFLELGHARGSTAIASVARLFRRGHYDISFSMVSMNLAAVAARIAARSSVRLVLGARNHYSRSLPEEATASRLKMLAIRAMYPRADLVIAVSQGVAQDLAANFGVPPSKILAIHNPIDIEGVSSLAREPLDDPWFGEDEADPSLVAVGKLQRAKGYPDLLAAFRRVRAVVPARLVILGEGPDRPALEALVDSYGLRDSVRFVGFDTNPYRWLGRAAAFVHAAHWEGFPNVIVEAMACGAPVITTDCPSGPAEILTDGVNGFLVPVGDVAAHADRTIKVLTDAALRGRIRDEASRRVQDFAVDRIVDRYAAAFEGVLAK